MPFCSKCGAQNQDEASTCVSCGNSLKLETLALANDAGGGFLDKIKKFVNDLLQFFDSGDFFKVSWKWICYHLLAVFYVLVPIAYILASLQMAIKLAKLDMLPAKLVIIGFIFLIFLGTASLLAFLAVRNRTEKFDELTKNFSMSKVTLANFYDFFKSALIHTIETNVYTIGIFASIAIFGLGFCSIFVEEINKFTGYFGLSGLIIGPLYSYINIFVTKIIVLFLTVFLEYLPKLVIIPIRALYNLFGVVIDTRHNLWK